MFIERLALAVIMPFHLCNSSVRLLVSSSFRTETHMCRASQLVAVEQKFQSGLLVYKDFALFNVQSWGNLLLINIFTKPYTN